MFVLRDALAWGRRVAFHDAFDELRDAALSSCSLADFGARGEDA
jgi:hypothetical protein